ncbi:hydrolase [Aureimonas flava]|uniref:Hydrolase n=1 Tax=Aureimonas flava TaxID=2320271 RepID=A0A3A1WLS6_9HYPH|nr:nitrilase-related carbon-nitrogen hydrolase [Aureimonas flava]RIY02496.1 hydrolase [Aureimonas flava]
MRLALFQLDAAEAGDGEAGIARARRCLLRAREAGAALAHLPELAIPGYGVEPEALQAEAAQAPAALARLGRMVHETGVALALGMPIPEGGAVRNAAVFLAPGAAPVVYAKRFLYGEHERAAFRPGTVGAPVVAFAGLRIGLLVCFDVEFPETVRALALAGADLVLVPTALPAGAGARFIARTLVPARAFENGLFLSYADWCGADRRFRFQGLSAVAGPDGALLAAADETGAAMLVADLDPTAIEAARAANDYLGELRAWRERGRADG